MFLHHFVATLYRLFVANPVLSVFAVVGLIVSGVLGLSGIIDGRVQPNIALGPLFTIGLGSALSTGSRAIGARPPLLPVSPSARAISETLAFLLLPLVSSLTAALFLPPLLPAALWSLVLTFSIGVFVVARDEPPRARRRIAAVVSPIVGSAALAGATFGEEPLLAALAVVPLALLSWRPGPAPGRKRSGRRTTRHRPARPPEVQFQLDLLRAAAQGLLAILLVVGALATAFQVMLPRLRSGADDSSTLLLLMLAPWIFWGFRGRPAGLVAGNGSESPVRPNSWLPIRPRTVYRSYWMAAFAIAALGISALALVFSKDLVAALPTIGVGAAFATGIAGMAVNSTRRRELMIPSLLALAAALVSLGYGTIAESAAVLALGVVISLGLSASSTPALVGERVI